MAQLRKNSEDPGGKRTDPESWLLPVTRGSEANFMESDNAIAKRFSHDLRQLHLRAGKPSYSVLEQLSGHQLRRATMSDILNGNRVNLPDWGFVARFVEACHAAAAKRMINTQDLGSVADWKRHWDGACQGTLDAGFPGGRVSVARDPGLITGAGSPDRSDGHASTDDAHRPSVWGAVPPRLTDFVGREHWLAELRRLLASESEPSPVTIQGLCGIGKTQLAVEYAHRYATHYDLVWWIPCDDPASARRTMAELWVRLGLPGSPPEGDDGDYGELFDRLRQGSPPLRWLLIFDNANEPGEIRLLIQPLGGHVLITSRNSSWEATGETLELDAFTREESIQFLHHRMSRYGQAEAYRIAETMGDLPLYLEHVVESRIAVGEYLAQLMSNPLKLLDSQPSDYPASVATQWRRSLLRLREQVPDALHLLNCLSFFSRAPIPREAVERASFLPLRSTELQAVLRDPIRRNRAIMMLRRAGLLHVDASANTLTVHPIARYIIRDMVARNGVSAPELSRHDAHLLLAAADPLNPEDPANWRSYEQLREHASETDVEGCSDEAARRLVINLVRFLKAAGDPHSALGLADSALSRWATEGDREASLAYDGCLTMDQARVDALFACGRHREAFESQQEALRRMRSAPGDWGEEITLLGAVPGARWRMLGRFAEALEADRESHRRHMDRFGRDHPRSFAAATAVVVDLTLTGQFTDAVQEARQVYEDCRAFHNDDSHPAVLLQRSVLGRCQWLHGHHDEAARTMTQVNAGYRALADRGVLGGNHPWRLAHEVDLVVVRRDVGPSERELAVLAGIMPDIRRSCWRALGPEHPQTLAATVVLASILRRIPGRTGEAVTLVADAEQRYQRAMPEHPFTLACTGYLDALREQASGGPPDAVIDFTPLPL